MASTMAAYGIIPPPPRMSSGFLKKSQSTENKQLMHTDSHCFTSLTAPFVLQRALKTPAPGTPNARCPNAEPTEPCAYARTVPGILLAMCGRSTCICGKVLRVDPPPACLSLRPSDRLNCPALLVTRDRPTRNFRMWRKETVTAQIGLPTRPRPAGERLARLCLRQTSRRCGG